MDEIREAKIARLAGVAFDAREKVDMLMARNVANLDYEGRRQADIDLSIARAKANEAGLALMYAELGLDDAQA